MIRKPIYAFGNKIIATPRFTFEIKLKVFNSIQFYFFENTEGMVVKIVFVIGFIAHFKIRRRLKLCYKLEID